MSSAADRALFVPYKAIGYVTDGRPFCAHRLGSEVFLIASVGPAFQVIRADHLTVSLVSRSVDGDITALQAHKHDTFAAVGKDVVVFHRNKIVRTYREHDAKVLGLLLVGPVLLSFDESNVVVITDIKARSVVDSIKLLRSASVTTLMHPATYMNKVVFGFADGALELWNVRSRKLVHTFACIKQCFEAAGESKCPAITCIEQSPAADVVAVGFASGDILIVNLKIDKVLFSFSQKGSVTSLGFRTDEAAYTGVMPYLLSSSSTGAVHVWNLGGGEASAEEGASEAAGGSRRGLVCSIDDAHALAVSRLYFLEGEPVFITSSGDNSIKTWIFDQPVGHAPRLLRSREGHIAPPNLIRYYGTGGGGSTNASLRDAADGFSCEIISAGSAGDLRVMNTARESQNKEMSQKNILKKLGYDSRRSRLPPTIGFDFAESRDRDWGNLVTIHKDRGDAYSWRYKHRASTEMVLRQTSWKTNEKMFAADASIHSTSVAVSACGNFCVIGNKGGSIHRYNLQSGLPRGSFPRSAASALMKEGTKKLRERMPGNVLHSHRQIVGMDDGTSATGFLTSGMTAAESRKAEATKIKAKSIATDAYIAHLQQHGHEGSSVTGLFVDAMNEILVSSGDDAQGHLIFWSYDRQDIFGYVLVGKPIVQLVGFRDGNFVACVTADNSIFVYDIITRRLSRKFTGGHSSRITSLVFTPDGRRLISGSLDGSVRVWDMLTARCLAWVTVKLPITSLALSPSGEFLCLTLEGKQGIFMYADRSLFETVHFWKEPTEPTPVTVSLAAIDSNTAEKEDSTMNYHENSDDEEEDADARKAKATQEAEEDGEMASSYKESDEQRSKGSITFSSIPRAYWVSLFNMEAIKARNRPIEPPKAPEKAPFFLPTLHRGASAPSFPTPQEYEKLVASKGDVAANDKKRKLEAGAEDNAPSKKSLKSSESATEEERAAQELASMGVWKDEEVDGEASGSGGSAWPSSGDWGDDNGNEEEDAEEEEEEPMPASTSRLLSSFSNKNSEKKIISKRTVLPRCKLVKYLFDEIPEGDISRLTLTSFIEKSKKPDEADGPIITYLKSISPPAIDLEFRALHVHDEDSEGLELLRCLMLWLGREISSGRNFEVVQAYLFRFLTIYSEVVLKEAALLADVAALKEVHAKSAERFRTLVQSNMCILKVMAHLPIA